MNRPVRAEPKIFASRNESFRHRRSGRAVRWRQIFRSNHLGHLTGADIEVLRRPAAVIKGGRRVDPGSVSD